MDERNPSDNKPAPHGCAWILSMILAAAFLCLKLIGHTGNFGFFAFLAIILSVFCMLLTPLMFVIDGIKRLRARDGPKIPAWKLVVPAVIWCGLIVFAAMGQTRSKVARVKGDIRTISMALEVYYMDHNQYPAWSIDPTQNAFGRVANLPPTLKVVPTFRHRNGTNLATLTTPISYMSSLYFDPFAPDRDATFAYWTNTVDDVTSAGFILWSPGPDRVYDLTIENINKVYDPRQSLPSPLLLSLTYDVSNGTKSRGDVCRYKQ